MPGLLRRTIAFFAAGLATATRDRSVEDERVYDALISEHGDLIRRICFYYASSQEAYDDLRQDVLLNIWRGLPKFRDEAQPSTWIYRICLNTCITSWRRERRHRGTLPLEAVVECAADDDRSRCEDVEQLYYMISRLSPSEKALIMMQLDGMSYEEMSQVTGYPRNTVASRLHRIRQKMRRSIDDETLKN